MDGSVTIPELTEVVARLSALLGPREGTVVQLEGGITNRNFRVIFGGTDYVLRLPGKRTELLGIDREAECIATKAAAGLGFAPRVVTLLEDPSCLVTAFLPGEHVHAAELRKPDAIREVARNLRALHDSGTKLPKDFDPFRLMEDYAQTARDHGAEVPEGYDEALATTKEIEEAIRGEPGHEPVPAHNDLLPANFLQGDDRLQLLDWEYTGMGDRWFDLGNFAANNELNDEQEAQLLEAYFGSAPDERARATLKLFRFVSDFREGMWGTVQSVLSEVDFDFRDYARRHFKRVEELRADPRFEEWLERVRGSGEPRVRRGLRRGR
jgi:thiamine kinase-like enzyme